MSIYRPVVKPRRPPTKGGSHDPHRSFHQGFSVRKDGERYIITGRPESELEPKFLARDTEDGELFLLFGDCFAFCFEQDGVGGFVTDPDDLQRQKPQHGQTPLNVVPFQIE